MSGDSRNPREDVWKAITDPIELAMWFDNEAVIDCRNGGTIDFVTGLQDSIPQATF